MARILTFLGKDRDNCTIMAIASGYKLADEGERVLVVAQDARPNWGKNLNLSPSFEPQTIAPNLKVVRLATSLLLEKGWEEIKALEKQYLRSPILEKVYAQELGILPGMDEALALNALREYDACGEYDVIIYDGAANSSTLRMFGIPEILSWYFRRFRQLFLDSDLVKALSPFVQPITSAILNVSWSFDDLAPESSKNRANQILAEGIAALANPQRISAYLVTDPGEDAIATAQFLWGCTQQVGLTVAGVLVNEKEITSELEQKFAPLSLTAIPIENSNDWQGLGEKLPDLQTPSHTPLPLEIDANKREVRVFLPGFDKKQVKLTQTGPELTIEAGDQRRNLLLPSPLAGKPVKGAKFEQGYLIISL
jgi:anion-transporting  ArsA/GET3 family ATPase